MAPLVMEQRRAVMTRRRRNKQPGLGHDNDESVAGGKKYGGVHEACIMYNTHAPWSQSKTGRGSEVEGHHEQPIEFDDGL